jgi:large subunit ribosomal protein L5
LTAITGQKPTMVLSKKNVSNFKLREGMPSMLKVTLRGKKAYYFLFKLMSIVLPRVRDFA